MVEKSEAVDRSRDRAKDLDVTQDRDLGAFLVEIQPRLRGVLAQFRIPMEDAEDVVQQAMLALVYQWDTVRDPEAWLVGTVRNKCLVYWRDRRRRLYETVDSVLLNWLAVNDRPAQTRFELVQDLSTLIARLPKRCQEILRLRYSLGYKPAEIAEELGYQPSSVSKITSRCMAGLLKQMVRSGYCAPPEKESDDTSELGSS